MGLEKIRNQLLSISACVNLMLPKGIVSELDGGVRGPLVI